MKRDNKFTETYQKRFDMHLQETHSKLRKDCPKLNDERLRVCAEEVVTKVYFEVWKQIQKRNSIDDIEGYIRISLRNEVYRKVKKIRRTSGLLKRLAEKLEISEDNSAVHDLQKIRDWVRQKYSPRQSYIFEAHLENKYKGIPIKEVIAVRKDDYQTRFNATLTDSFFRKTVSVITKELREQNNRQQTFWFLLILNFIFS